MMVSTKGRYALRVMLDLSLHDTDDYISLKVIAERQGISMKYLEMVVAMLHKAKMVRSMRGKDGGYQLSRKPSEYTIGSILKLTEGTLAPVACVEDGRPACTRAENCLTLPMWMQLDEIIDQYLESVTLEDLILGRAKIGSEGQEDYELFDQEHESTGL